ncbi:MAG: CDP-alcohol phosphatidyltransferase family protein [Planctomycetes bacterium]|nr:CDP-alcohol phosphatidyltransferase family protein [Planctomycetota bacterium]
MASAWEEIKKLHKASTFGAKEGVAFRYFSRPLASFTLYHIQHTRITPNQVTILSLIVALIGFGVQMTMLSYAGLLIGAGLFMIAHMLDALDGQLARHKKAGSVIGMYFDFFIDELKAYFVFMAIGFRIWQQLRNGVRFPLLDPMIHWWAKHFDGQVPDAGDIPAIPGVGSDVILVILVVGMTGLAIGISCTQFVKRQEWKDAFPAGAGGGKPGGIKALIGLIEKAGKFVVDYPSYILLVCLVNKVEIYFVVYAAVVSVYAVRALFGIALKLWRIDPYQPKAS